MNSSHSSSLSAVATIKDLPTELLLQILDDVDNHSLYQLSRTYKAFNTLVLPILFARSDISTPMRGHVVARRSPKETLPALRIAFDIKKLRKMCYYFNPGVNRLMSEVRDMRDLIGRLESIDIVEFHFWVFDLWLSGYHSDNYPMNREATIDGEIWRSSFTELLDTVLLKSCRELYVSDAYKLLTIITPCQGGSTPLQRYEDPVVLGLSNNTRVERRKKRKILNSGTTFQTLDTKLRSLFHRKPANTKSEDTPPPPTPPPPPLYVSKPVKGCLNSFEIHTNMLLMDLFLDWTIQSLRANASTLTELWFQYDNTPAENWHQLFESITLPHLTRFNITTASLTIDNPCSQFTDIADFLSRHPSITNLDLYGVSVPEPKSPLSANHNILPNLTTVTAHPQYISWILGSNSTFVHLRSVRLITECYRRGIFDHDLLDIGIASVAERAQWQEFELGFRFSVKIGLTAWMLKHIEASRNEENNNNPISKLHSIKDLLFNPFWFVEFDPDVLDVLPEFLALFPSLERVKLMNQLEYPWSEVRHKPFLDALCLICPGLLTLSVDTNPALDLVSMRKELLHKKTTTPDPEFTQVKHLQ